MTTKERKEYPGYYSFDAETEKRLGEIGITLPRPGALFYSDKQLDVGIAAKANDKYNISVDVIVDRGADTLGTLRERLKEKYQLAEKAIEILET